MFRHLSVFIALPLTLILLLTALSGAVFAAPLTQDSTPAGSGTIAVTIPPRMNVRTGPATTYRVAGSVPAGTEVKIIGENADGAWARVEIDGFAGPLWLAKRLLRMPEGAEEA